MLKVSEIEVRYSGVPVIHNVSLEVNQGELVSVVGSNGSGKSTLLKTIAGALRPRLYPSNRTDHPTRNR
jgi:branched-chain amino acid transport system ATP-binding protein